MSQTFSEQDLIEIYLLWKQEHMTTDFLAQRFGVHKDLMVQRIHLGHKYYLKSRGRYPEGWDQVTV